MYEFYVIGIMYMYNLHILIETEVGDDRTYYNNENEIIIYNISNTSTSVFRTDLKYKKRYITNVMKRRVNSYTSKPMFEKCAVVERN